MTNENTFAVDACPVCSDSRLRRRMTFPPEEKWICEVCSETFAEPTVRPPKSDKPVRYESQEALNEANVGRGT